MHLNIAIKKVLEDAGKPLPPKSIADEINSRKLYTRKDNSPVPSSQVSARIRKYPKDFYSDKGLIYLKKDLMFVEEEPETYSLKKNTRNLLTHGNIEAYRRNIIDQIRQEIRQSDLKTIQPYNESIIEIALALNELYIESRGLSLTSFVKKSGMLPEGSEDGSDIKSHGKSLPQTIQVLLGEYLESFKVLKGKDLIHFYLEIVDDRIGQWEVATPEWISKLLVQLADPQIDDKVWDPAAGTGRTLLDVIELNPFVDPYGCEINAQAQKLARAVLNLEKVPSTGILHSDALEVTHGPFELVISDPPKGRLRIKNSADDRRMYSEGSAVFLSKMIDCTIEGGTTAAVVADSVLSSQILRDIRSKILNESWIRTVISLPTAKIKIRLGVSQSIVVLQKKHEGDIKSKFAARFIDGEKLLASIKLDFPSMNEFEQLNEFVDRAVDLSKAKDISFLDYVKDILQEELNHRDNLTPRYHTSPSKTTIELLESKGENLVELSDLLSSTGAARPQGEELDEELYIIQPRDLYSNIDIQFLINNPGQPGREYYSRPYRILNDDAILINRMVDYFAPTYVEIKDQKVGLNINIYAFKWDQELVLPEYLVQQLRSDLVNQQLNSLAVGSTMKYVQKKDILSIKIPLPPLSVQVEQIRKSEKEIAEKSEIIKFISQIQLVETKDELKAELERYVTDNYFQNANPVYISEMEKEYPFTVEDINENIWFKQSTDGAYGYLLIYNEGRPAGALRLEDIGRVDPKIYHEIEAYAKFLYKTTKFILHSTANNNLADFAHKLKNEFPELVLKLNDILTSKDPQFNSTLDSLSPHSDQFMNYQLTKHGGEKTDYSLRSIIEGLKRKLSLMARFYEGLHVVYKDIVDNEPVEFDLIKVIKEIDSNSTVKGVDKSGELLVIGKIQSVKSAFKDLIQNSKEYSPINIGIVSVFDNVNYVEVFIENDVDDKVIISESKYELLGRKWLSKEDGGTGSGVFRAFQSIRDSDGETELLSYSDYIKEKKFKVRVKLRKKRN